METKRTLQEKLGNMNFWYYFVAHYFSAFDIL